MTLETLVKRKVLLNLAIVVLAFGLLMAALLFNTLQEQAGNRRRLAQLYNGPVEMLLAERASFPGEFMRAYCGGLGLAAREAIRERVRGYESLESVTEDGVSIDRYTFAPLAFPGRTVLEVCYDEDGALADIRTEGPQVILRPVAPPGTPPRALVPSTSS